MKVGGQPTVQKPASPPVAQEPKKKKIESAASGTPAVKKDPADTNQMKGEMGFAGQAQMAVVAERYQSTRVSPNQQVDITNPEARNNLLRNTPQMNPISKAQGNGPHLCGGAAMANALILSAKTPEQAKANGQAVRKSVDALAQQDKANQSKVPFKLSADEDAALKRFESGKASPNDAMHMQQIMYKLGKRAPIGGLSNPEGEGLSTSQIASTMSMLKANGAFQGSSVTMHCNRMPTGFDHWTTTVDKIHVNSQHGPKDKSMVTGGPPGDFNKSNSNWQNEIWLNPWAPKEDVTVQFRGEKPGQVNQAVMESSRYDGPGKLGDFEADLFKSHRPVEQ